MTEVAVLGAGFQGTCVALELATRGIDVDLYDRNDACITQAGRRNEGKIHLGFVYAHDPTLDTARLLVRGALGFDGAVRRWLEREAAVGLSTPHTYAVHRDSLLPPDAVLAHFARVRDLVRELGQARPCTYLGQDPRSVGFERVELGAAYDPAHIAAAIRTDERAVDVGQLAALLGDRVAADPRIRFHPRTEITGAARDHGSIAVSLTHDGLAASRRYGQVVNCLWDGKLAVDQSMDFLPAYRSLVRLKFGVHLELRQPDRSVPSTTFVVGSFGDIVQLDDRRLYLSWYPVARTALSTALAPPPDWARELAGDDARRMIDQTLDAFGRLVPPLRSFHHGLFQSTWVAGGVILAAGDTDIDDPHSRLHARTEVGVRSARGYHSIDTGKYTLAPMFALEVADRVSEAAGGTS